MWDYTGMMWVYWGLCRCFERHMMGGRSSGRGYDCDDSAAHVSDDCCYNYDDMASACTLQLLRDSVYIRAT